MLFATAARHACATVGLGVPAGARQRPRAIRQRAVTEICEGDSTAPSPMHGSVEGEDLRPETTRREYAAYI